MLNSNAFSQEANHYTKWSCLFPVQQSPRTHQTTAHLPPSFKQHILNSWLKVICKNYVLYLCLVYTIRISHLMSLTIKLRARCAQAYCACQRRNVVPQNLILPLYAVFKYLLHTKQNDLLQHIEITKLILVLVLVQVQYFVKN